MYAVRGLENVAPATNPREFSCRLMWGPGERELSCRKWGGRSAEPEATDLVHVIDSALPKSYRFSGCRSQMMEACVWTSSANRYPTVALLYGNSGGNYEYHLNVYAEYAGKP